MPSQTEGDDLVESLLELKARLDVEDMDARREALMNPDPLISLVEELHRNTERMGQMLVRIHLLAYLGCLGTGVDPRLLDGD